MVTLDAEYHNKCLVSLYNKVRCTKSSTEPDEDEVNHGIAFAELISYIEEVHGDNLIAPIFYLSDLVNLYSKRLEQLGCNVTGRVHSTRLKNRILSYFPEMEAHSQGNKVILAFKDDVGSALRNKSDIDADSDAIHLARAAKIVRREMFKVKMGFNGPFDARCQEESVPVSLLALVSMVLNGPNIESQSSCSTGSQHALTLSQLLLYNSSKRHRNEPTDSFRHNQERETPVPIYIGMMVHSKTRKRELVDILFSLGLSISYDRVLSISTELGNKVCYHYQHENVVCPPTLKGNIFTTAAVDNIDHNTTSISACDSFHGTGISLFQHPDDNHIGFERESISVPDDSHSTNKLYLPESYTTVPPVPVCKADSPVPKLAGPNRSYCEQISDAIAVEYR